MKKFKYMKLCVLSIILIASGALLGSYLTEQRIERMEGSTFQTTKLAVVNLDEGVEYEGEHRNFAKELISSQKKDIVLTGLEDAKAGMQDGRYSGYLIMPSDFSTNTVTVNDEPQKSLIKYEINQNLSDAARDKATVNISEVTKSLNDDLGYVYLYSLFNSVHEGQNNALKVLSNDNQDKEVLMAISNIDLIESLDLTEVERMENNIENLNVVDDFEKNQELINTIDIAYKGYLSATSEELTNVKTDSNAVKERLTQMGVDISNIPTIESDGYVLSAMDKVVSDHNTSLGNSKSNISQDVESIKGSNDDTLSTAKTTMDTYLDDIDAYNEKIIKLKKYHCIKKHVENIAETLSLNKLASFNSKFTILIKDAQTKHIEAFIHKYLIEQLVGYYGTYASEEEVLQQIFIDASTDEGIKEAIVLYAQLHPELNITTLNDYYAYMFGIDSGMSLSVYPDETTIKAEALENLKTDLALITKPILYDLDGLKNDFPAIVKTTDVRADLKPFNDYLIDMTPIHTGLGSIEDAKINDLNDAVGRDLNPLKEKQSLHKNNLSQKANNDNGTMEQFNNRFTIFDPLAFIDGRQIEGYVRDYQRNTSSVENNINRKDQEYKKFVDDSYTEANEHMRVAREDISKYQKLSDDKLSDGLKVAHASRSSTSGENQQLMNNFINTLPYSRLGENANTSVYQFMVEPTVAESGVGSTMKRSNSEIDYNGIFISVVGACLIVFSGLSIYTFSKKRSVRD